jgi:hypothetical protein
VPLQHLENPAQLTTLSPDELVAYCYPLLRKAGFTRGSDRFKRVWQNIPSVLAEIAAEWQHDGRLDGRAVSFDEYIAARLALAIHELDQQQNPHLYDDHRYYRPENHTLPLCIEIDGEETLRQLPIGPDSDAATVYTTTQSSFADRLQETMRSSALEVASQTHLLEATRLVRNGELTNTYRFTRFLLGSRNEARARPATAAFLEIRDAEDTFML